MNLSKNVCPSIQPIDIAMNNDIPAMDVLNCTKKRATIASTFSTASKMKKIGVIMKIEYLKLIREKKY